jgi:hypothetical protein
MSLHSELTTDPLGIGYAGMSDAERQASLNEKRYALVGKLPIDEFMAVLYETGVFDALFDAAEGGNAAIAKEIKRLQMLKGFGINNLDFANAAVPARLLAAGIPAEVVDVLTAKATVMKSRADLLGLPEVKLT